MPLSSNQWFVQMDLGVVLGPMPRDELVDLAQTGALLERDLVRNGADGTWQSAGDVHGLFNGCDPSGSPACEPTEPASTASFSVASPRKAGVAKKSQQRIVSEAAQDDLPLLDPSEFDSVLPVFESGSRAAVPPLGLSSSEPATPLLPHPVHDEPTLPPEPAPLVVFPQRSEPPSIRRPSTASVAVERGRVSRIVPVLIATAVACVVLVTGWWFWPGQEPDIYANYVAIYREWQERREGAQEQSGWDEFAARSKARIDASIPWLETHAQPGDRKTSLLLYAGRDLREILNHPRDFQSPHQRRLDGFFDQLNRIYASSK